MRHNVQQCFANKMLYLLHRVFVSRALDLPTRHCSRHSAECQGENDVGKVWISCRNCFGILNLAQCTKRDKKRKKWQKNVLISCFFYSERATIERKIILEAHFNNLINAAQNRSSLFEQFPIDTMTAWGFEAYKNIVDNRKLDRNAPNYHRYEEQTSSESVLRYYCIAFFAEYECCRKQKPQRKQTIRVKLQQQ